MILVILHLVACVALFGAAVYRWIRHGAAEGTHKFLFPFILAATVSAALAIGVRIFELYEIFYNGTYYVMSYSASGRYIDARWLNLTEFFLLMLPGFGLFPRIGRCPWLMATLALLSASPGVISPLMFF